MQSNVALEKHDKDILEKIREAEKQILERIAVMNPSGSGMYLKTWQY